MRLVLQFPRVGERVDASGLRWKDVKGVPHENEALVCKVGLGVRNSRWMLRLHDEHAVVLVAFALEADHLEDGARVDAK